MTAANDGAEYRREYIKYFGKHEVKESSNDGTSSFVSESNF